MKPIGTGELFDEEQEGERRKSTGITKRDKSK